MKAAEKWVRKTETIQVRFSEVEVRRRGQVGQTGRVR